MTDAPSSAHVAMGSAVEIVVVVAGAVSVLGLFVGYKEWAHRRYVRRIMKAADDIITDIERITDTIAELGMIDEGDEDD